MRPLTATTEVLPSYPTNLAGTKKLGNAGEKKEAIKLLREVGIDVEQEKAELIMEFLYNLTMIIIRECFDTE